MDVFFEKEDIYTKTSDGEEVQAISVRRIYQEFIDGYYLNVSLSLSLRL
ncbi:MAG: hypothetical protein ACJAX4_004765 [Clostridium sp.]